MLIAVLSDIHGNLEALEAVLEDVERAGADVVYSLGDIVGYGADPAACIDLVRRRAEVSLIGNHDAAAAGVTSLEDFNEFARFAVEWSAARLDAERLEYLRALPLTHRAPNALWVHASPLEPERWHYIHGVGDVGEHFAAFAERICFVGHTHRGGICAMREGEPVEWYGSPERLRPGLRYLVNAGSVGQPRDRDARASYALFDSTNQRVELRRVAYPVVLAQEKIRAAGLPTFLAERLAAGV